MYILGISAYYHDSAACLVKSGEIIAAAQEERFSRKKHDSSFPSKAIEFCLAQAGISIDQVESIVFYDKPFLTFERLLETYFAFAPLGLRSFLKSMPVWLKEKLYMRGTLQKQFQENFGYKASTILFSEHHQSHAASAFYPSPFKEAAVLCLDGVGEWATSSTWFGNGNQLNPLWEIQFPHSLGLLYSAITYYTGFKVNSGEYKVMGLAPYGQPKYKQKILDHLIDIKDDGTFRLNMEYFNYCIGLTMTNEKFNHLFGGPPRKPESEVTQKEMDMARSVQEVTEEVLFRLAKTLKTETGANNLCLAGGVALNCVANGKLLKRGPFEKIWIQPAAGDSGGAIGAALSAWYQYYGNPRSTSNQDAMKGSFLGPSYSNENIEAFLRKRSIPFHRYSDADLYEKISQDIADEKIIGWFQGRMEFGPRALGARSIIGDARSPRMQSVMNLKIKYRESFRPFAPAVLREKASQYFELDVDSPYMLLVAPIQENRRKPLSEKNSALWGIDLLNIPKSDIPAVTHVDYSARVQTVHRQSNPRFYNLIEAFERKTNSAVVVNTSFNVRGEPIVCSPEDAYRCFMRTEIDTLVLENCVIEKSKQPKFEDSDWTKEFELD